MHSVAVPVQVVFAAVTVIGLNVTEHDWPAVLVMVSVGW